MPRTREEIDKVVAKQLAAWVAEYWYSQKKSKELLAKVLCKAFQFGLELRECGEEMPKCSWCRTNISKEAKRDDGICSECKDRGHPPSEQQENAATTDNTLEAWSDIILNRED